VAEASTLRLQPLLMSVITASQDRCKCTWSGAGEKPLRNNRYETFLNKAKKGELVWTKGQTQLYLDLAVWRSCVAQDLDCLEQFVASLDFLVTIAWKLPRTVLALRRIMYHFPDVLEDNVKYQSQLLDIVKKAIVKDEELAGIETKPIPLYRERNKKRDTGIKRPSVFLMIGVITVGVVVAMTIPRKIRRI